MTIYLSGATQVSKLEEAAKPTILQWNKASTKILAKYTDYADVFSSNLVIELPKNTNINEHTIKLIKRK